MAVSAEKRSSRVRRQASKKQPKNRTVQVRFSDEELAALDAVCESTGMTRSAVLRSWTVPGEGAGSNPVYVVTKNADAERLAMEARRIGVNVNQMASALNAKAKERLCLMDARIRTLMAEPEEGAATAEYAVVLVAATGFAAVLVAILKSDAIKTLLTNIIKQALKVG